MRKCTFTAFRIVSCFALLLFFAFLVFAQTPNPVPYLNQPVLPDSVAPGGPGFTLTVTGSAFVSGAHVNWNGSPRATTFVSATQLTATILASDIAHASTATITVTNPAPAGGLSNFQFLTVTSPISSPAFARMDEGIGDPGSAALDAPAVGDFNGDGILDFALGAAFVSDCETCHSGPQDVCVFLGVGDGTFRAPTCYDTMTTYDEFITQGQFLALYTADLNGDGKLDLIAVDSNHTTVSVFLGNGNGTFQPVQNTVVPPANQEIFLDLDSIADFNRDGKLDMILTTTGPSGDQTLEFLGNGDGTFAAPVTVSTGNTYASQLVGGDFNRDGNLDFIFLGDSGLVFLPGNADGTFGPPQNISSQTGTLYVGDFNNDGNLDVLEVISPTSSTQSLSVFLGNGDGTFQAPKNSSSPLYAAIGVFGDVNGDGNLDYVASDNNQSIVIQLGNGDGTFKPAISYPVATYFSGDLALGDFNRDGMMDILSLNGGVTITDEGVITPSSISVDIQGIFPIAELSPSTLPFNDIGLGTKEPETVSLTNTGSATLTISSISVSGSPKPNELTQTNNCGSFLAPNASCTITVTFISLGGGNMSASLVITDNAAGSPQSVAITAPSPDFTITSNTTSTVTVNPGQSATYGITVSGLANFSGTVALSCSGAPSGSNCTVSPGSVNATSNPDGPQGTATVTVSTTPTTSAVGKPPRFPTLTAPQFVKFASALIAISLLILIAAPRRQRKFAGYLTITLFVAGMIGMSSCGGSGGGSNGNGTPAGTYTITITGKFVGGTTLTHTKQLTLVVK